MSQLNFLHRFLEEWNAGNGISAKTSGSTGTPKAITLTQCHVERSARRTNLFFGINRKSRLHSAVSFEYIGGKMMIARSLLARCSLTFSEPSLRIELPPDSKPVSLMALVPAQMHFILDNPDMFSGVEKFLIGGAPISDGLWQRIVASGFNVWESYGMTETASHIALRRVAGHFDSRPAFVAFPGIILSQDSENCLCIRDKEVSVVTNDVVRLGFGRNLEILGRRDDVIVTGGVKVLPQSVEKIIRPYIRHLCRDFFISSLPDEVWSSRLVLLFLPTEDSESVSLSMAIRHSIDSIPLDFLQKRLRPKDIIPVSRFPETPNGKLIRNLDDLELNSLK